MSKYLAVYVNSDLKIKIHSEWIDTQFLTTIIETYLKRFEGAKLLFQWE